MVSKKTMEINPNHPIMKALRSQVVEQLNTNSLKDIVNLLFESALINSGFSLEEPSLFVNRINRIIKLGLSIDDEEENEEKEEKEENEENEEEKEENDEESNMEEID
jgi:molecular chaperone HtpG